MEDFDSSSETPAIDTRELVAIARRNLVPLTICMLVCVSLAVIALKSVPKRYKATSVLNIQASYFQTPLVGDLVSEVFDPGELSAQKKALLRLALSDDFLDTLGEKYGQFNSKPKTRERAIERESLFKRIEYYSTGPSTYQISVISTSPTTSYKLNKEVLDQMIKTLIDTRRNNIIRTRNSIESHVQSLGLALKDSFGVGASQHPEVIQGELNSIQATIEVLSNQYTGRHPEVLKLKRRASVLQKLLEKAETKAEELGEKEGPSSTQRMLGKSAKQPTQEVYHDLLRKLSYLNVVVDMESEGPNVPYLGIVEHPTVPVSAFFPKAKVFLMFGAGLGLVFGVLISLFLEYKRGTFLSPRYAASALNTAYLGELPSMSTKDLMRLLEGSGRTLLDGPRWNRPSLPAPAAHE